MSHIRVEHAITQVGHDRNVGTTPDFKIKAEGHEHEDHTKHLN